MLRTLLRTSRRLVRLEINKTLILSCATKVRISFDTPALNIRARAFSSVSSSDDLKVDSVDPLVYEKVCSETLESLCDYFEELVEESANFKGADVTYSDGVLTVFLGKEYGTYVINRQSPNKQIWLSSPASGPKRYDLVLEGDGHWIYKHDGISLHSLLQTEISLIAGSKVEFSKCSHSLV